ncbi:FDLD family class I lanthipeptide [Kitasatospora sp. NPDC008050]|uniref:FDLD family class I lanthipeptide n=1 Tax=Kitasatospora sp. NPDC008050 TaxID=3364021 RepID=UPI0036EFC478
MSTATLPSVIEDIDIQDLFDLDIRIERTENTAEDSWTTFGCPSISCPSWLPTTCCI